VVVVESEDGVSIDADKLCAAIDERTRLVAISHVLFRSAFIVDAAKVAAHAHRMGALVSLDAFHSVGIIPVDVQAIGADFLTVGMETGDLAADVLGGRNLKDVPVINRVPERFNLNLVSLAKFPKWHLPPGVADEAQVLIDASGERNDKATRGH
jgi:hypothetical protein